MTNSARIAAWKPVDVDALELAAEDAVRTMDNTLVIAGPGAGKTELLAQRACFLLQTGVCASPRRILAISFKRDAARNLRERVSRRCGRELASRCRMRPPQYTERLRAALDSVNVRSRVENDLQDLLAEPLVEAILNILKLACRQSSPEAWGRIVALLAELGGDDSESGMRRIVDGLLNYLRYLRPKLQANTTSEDEIREIVSDIVEFLDEDAFREAHPQYQQDAWYEKVVKDFTKVLTEARAEYDWPDAIEEVEGVDSVPIMTTHKSKGLEYHTVVFVGLEDSAHFSFGKNPDEETCGFFVALSRAKHRVVFTFCNSRPTGRNGQVMAQQRKALAPLYKLLATAGVDVQVEGK